MFRREAREFISPLLQPPLNKLFVPRPTPDYLPPIDRDAKERIFAKVHPTAHYLDYQGSTEPPVNSEQRTTQKSTRKLRMTEKRVSIREAIDGQLETWNPVKNENATEDAYKTLFVGRLPYEITEGRLKREFERFGPIKAIKMVMDKAGGSRGYAFIEYERERDMKVAYVEADGMRLEGGGGSGRRVIVDVERGRTVKGWRPRRLGGGLGRTRVGGKDQNQRHSGRDHRANDILDELIRSGQHHPRKRSPSPRRHDRHDRDNRRRY